MIQKDFYEETAVKAKKSRTFWPTVIVIAVVVVLSVAATVMFRFIPILTISICGVILLVQLFRNRDIEYDYCFSTEEIEIGKVINKKRRRTAILFDFANIRFVAPKDSPRLDNEMERVPGMRFTDYTADEPKNPVYGFCLDLKGISTIILLEPTPEMMDHVRTMASNKVFED